MSRSISIVFIASFFLVCGCDSFDTTTKQISNFMGRLGENASGKTPRNAAVKMEDQYFPDERREGINELVKKDFGKREPYTTRYDQIAKSDDDWLVRATAIRALNRARDRSATPTFIKALDDKNDQVRLEACKALVHMPDENAVPSLVRIVQDPAESRDVRIAAADALQHYRTLEVARALTNNLGGRDFGVAWQSHQTLILLTGHDLRYDEAAWLAYLTGPEKPFG
jgi:HEAT repeat protein